MPRDEDTKRWDSPSPSLTFVYVHLAIVADKLGVQVPIPELEELQKDVSPEQVLDAMDQARQNTHVQPRASM